MEDFVFKMDVMDNEIIRFIILFKDEEVGSLYFERAKKIFHRKPVSMNSWVCVDAKIERLYEVSNYDITPREIVERCQSIIGESLLFGFGQPSVDSINEPTEE